MTITVAPTKYRYQGNGVTPTFSYPNRVYVPTDLKVDILTRNTSALVETLTLTTDYSVTIAVNGQATVLITNALKIPSGTQDILVRLDLPKSQSLELPTGTPFPAASVESGLDKITTITQALEEVDSRTLKYAPQSPVTDTTIGEPVADAALTFDGTTGKIKAGPTTTDIADAASNAAIAAAAAIDAAESAEKLVGTSVTSLAIGTGGKAFTTQEDKFFTAGTWLLATSDADPTNYMHGYVSSYSGTSLVMVVTNVGGSGTHADWTIRVSGTRGAPGAAPTIPVPVSDGGTGLTTLTENAVILGNGTSDPTFVEPGTAGNVLTSNGTTWVSSASGAAGLQNFVIQVFTTSGTYTPTPGMLYCEVEVIGAGGAGSGRTGAGQYMTGGGAGGRAIRRLTAAQIGASQSVTIGAGGTGVSGGSGNDGGSTALGTLVSATGGIGGAFGASAIIGSSGGLGADGDVNIPGAPSAIAHVAAIGFAGASSPYGAGGREELANTNGKNASGYGAGGGASGSGGGGAAGGEGSNGLIVIREYL
jgi:hypothetical protein